MKKLFVIMAVVLFISVASSAVADRLGFFRFAAYGAAVVGFLVSTIEFDTRKYRPMAAIFAAVCVWLLGWLAYGLAAGIFK